MKNYLSPSITHSSSRRASGWAVAALTLAFSLPASALDITVNVGAHADAMNRVASGFLHPLGKQDPLPQTEIDTTAAYVTDLKIQTVRCEIEEVNEYLARFPNAVVIGTLSGNWSKPGTDPLIPKGVAPWATAGGTPANPNWNHSRPIAEGAGVQVPAAEEGKAWERRN